MPMCQQISAIVSEWTRTSHTVCQCLSPKKDKVNMHIHTITPQNPVLLNVNRSVPLCQCHCVRVDQDNDTVCQCLSPKDKNKHAIHRHTNKNTPQNPVLLNEGGSRFLQSPSVRFGSPPPRQSSRSVQGTKSQSQHFSHIQASEQTSLNQSIKMTAT